MLVAMKHKTTVDGKIVRSYRKWASMHARCTNPSHPAFYRYGGRGISVGLRWSGRGGYEHFMEDMGEPPEGLTLERKNRDGDYEPTNCRWATWKEQAANRKKGGPPRQPNSLRGLSRSSGLPFHVVYQRMAILGWEKDRALTTPVAVRRKKSVHDHVMQMIQDGV